jgi:TRAP transporter TAXI family solute receptor
MSKLLRSACALLLGLLLAAPSMAATSFITMGSGSTAGLYYPTAEGIAKIVNDANIGVRVGARSTGGSVFNAQAIQDGALQMAVMQNNIAYFAYRGEGITAFAGKPTKDLRGLATLYPEVLHILARKDSGVHSPADLKGKTVYVGDIGSGPEQDAIAVLGMYGLKLSDLKSAVRGSAGNAVNLLRDGKIDAMFYTVGIGSAAIVEAAQTTPIDVVPITPAKIAALHAKYPYYTGTVIPAGAYPHIDTNTPTIAVKATLVASDKLPAAEVERLMTTVFKTHLQNFYNDIPNPNLKKYFKLDTALDGMPIPLHPGAVAFYKSVGIKVPADLIAH